MKGKQPTAAGTFRCNLPATCLSVALVVFMTIGIEALHPLFHCHETAHCGSPCESRQDAERYIQAASDCGCPICESPYHFKASCPDGCEDAFRRICEAGQPHFLRFILPRLLFQSHSPRAPPA